jgi:hypothetical protein
LSSLRNSGLIPIGRIWLERAGQDIELSMMLFAYTPEKRRRRREIAGGGVHLDEEETRTPALGTTRRDESLAAATPPPSWSLVPTDVEI